ncbi:MAG: 4-(cytidine 5'-diphospho)-2-C-methyl-D-erythritol kinase [Eggerthellaceae bacterium]
MKGILVKSEATNMVETAANVQLNQARTSEQGWTKIIAPAKVNLFLGIGDKRSDGYHEALNIIHALTLHDLLYMKMRDDQAGSGLSLTLTESYKNGTSPLGISPEENIVYKVIYALAEAVGFDRDVHMDVHIEKSIPAQGGLGGGSSDAAAALLGAAELWGLSSDADEIFAVARTLGADVSFFLHGGCACFDGAGEHFQRNLVPLSEPIVLVRPDKGVLTCEAYQRFDTLESPIDEEAKKAALVAKEASEVILNNNLAPAAESLLPELREVREWLQGQKGVKQVLLCGSGSTTFAICDNVDSGYKISAAAQLRGWWSRTSSFSPVKAQVIPQA